MILIPICVGAVLLILSIKKGIPQTFIYIFNTLILYATLKQVIYDLKHANPLDGVIKTVVALIYLLMIRELNKKPPTE